jgi:hypothetical protein
LGAEPGGLASPTPSPPQVLPVAVLQPLGESSLAIITTLLTTTTEEAAGALPNQSALREAEEPVPEELSGSEGLEDEALPALPAQDALSPLYRFLYRLDESIEKAQRDARESPFGPSHPIGSAERSIRVLDAVLSRWSPGAGDHGRPLAGPPGEPGPGRSRRGPRDRLGPWDDRDREG